MGIFGFIKKRKASKLIEIGTVNVRWRGSFHTLPGASSDTSRFVYVIPFKNTISQNELIKDIAKEQVPDTMKILGVNVAQPFKLVSVDPNPPFEIKAGEKVEIKLTIDGPTAKYSGPMAVTIVEDQPETVKIGVNRVVLHRGSKSFEIPDSSIMMEIQKNMVFANKVQIYKIMGFGETASSISVSPPFKFVSSNPKLPFTVDDPNSYLVELYIQAPESSYAGQLDVYVN
ncbi:MAG: hypothetical protein QXN59_01460 [Candidatus Micrarchaeaceae archaeon]